MKIHKKVVSLYPEMSTNIEHQGIVESIDDEHVLVRITQTAACAGCKISGHCTSTESKDKLIDVYNDPLAKTRHVGDIVTVVASRSAAGRALLLSFGLPLLLMLLVFFVATACGCSQGVAALLMLGALLPYYIIIWLMRYNIAEQIAFRIE